LTSSRERQKSLKPSDLLEVCRLYWADLASKKYTGDTSISIKWTDGGINNLEFHKSAKLSTIEAIISWIGGKVGD